MKHRIIKPYQTALFWLEKVLALVILAGVFYAIILELLAFVIARKMLKPDLTAIDVFLGVTAFVALLGGRKYLMSQTCYDPRELNGDGNSGAPE